MGLNQIIPVVCVVLLRINAASAKSWRGIELVSLLDGGYREDMQVQLYLGRTDYYPPVLIPTVSPKKAQLIKQRLRRCNE